MANYKKGNLWILILVCMGCTQIVVQNTIVNQHEIINEVNTEVVNNVVNDITNNNVNIAEAVADSSSASIASAAADAYAESHPIENSKPTEATPSGNTSVMTAHGKQCCSYTHFFIGTHL